MVRTTAQSLDEQVRAFIAAFAHGDIPAGVVGVISAAMLLMPIAGLTYILLVMGKKGVLAVIAACRRRPILCLPYATAVLLVAAGLSAQWGLLPISGATSRQASAPGTAAVGDVSQVAAQSVAQSVAEPTTYPAIRHPAAKTTAVPHQAVLHLTTPKTPGTTRKAITLTPVGAHGFDALDTSGDPRDENDNLAGYAIDQNPATSWQSQYYLGSPVFGGLKAGTGLIVDMGEKVRIKSVTVTFGSTPGADVSIMVGNHDTLAAATLPTFTTIATADGVGGRHHTFKASRAVRGRYVLIWFTKLPPVSLGKYQAQVFNVVFHGSR